MNIRLNLFSMGESAATITAMERTYNNDLSPEMKEFYSKDLIELAKPLLVHAQFGEKVSIPKGSGRKIEWRKFSNFAKALTPLTEGVTPDPHQLKVTTQSVVVAQYGDYSILSDILQLTTIDPVVVEYTQRHSANAGLTMDTLVRNELIAGGDDAMMVTYASGADGIIPTSDDEMDANCTLKVDDVARIATYLKNNNAPKIDGSYVCIIHPSVAYDIMKDPAWIDVHKYNDASAIYDGEIGKIFGVRFVETTEAYCKVGSMDGETPTMYKCIFLGKGAYKTVDLNGSNVQVIVKANGSSGVNDPLNQRSSIGWVCDGFATKVVIPEYMYICKCFSSLTPVTAKSGDGETYTIPKANGPFENPGLPTDDPYAPKAPSTDDNG